MRLSAQRNIAIGWRKKPKDKGKNQSGDLKFLYRWNYVDTLVVICHMVALKRLLMTLFDGPAMFQGTIRVADGAVLDRETKSGFQIRLRVQDSPNHPNVSRYSWVSVSVFPVLQSLLHLGGGGGGGGW